MILIESWIQKLASARPLGSCCKMQWARNLWISKVPGGDGLAVNRYKWRRSNIISDRFHRKWGPNLISLQGMAGKNNMLSISFYEFHDISCLTIICTSLNLQHIGIYLAFLYKPKSDPSLICVDLHYIWLSHQGTNSYDISRYMLIICHWYAPYIRTLSAWNASD